MKLIITHLASDTDVNNNVNLAIHGPATENYINVDLCSFIDDLSSFRDALKAMHYAGARPGSLLVVHIEEPS